MYHHTNTNTNTTKTGETHRAFGNNLINSHRINENAKPGQQQKNAVKRNNNGVIKNHDRSSSSTRQKRSQSPPRQNLNIQQEVLPREGREPAEFLIRRNPSSYQYTGRVDDIDKRDRDDPLYVTPYVQDMYEHFRSTERRTPAYMKAQSHINERMRSILIDWLVEVHLKFKMVPETLYLTVNIIDRFLEKTQIERPHLQLVGVTSLLLASKYEEIYPPELHDLVYICDNAYNKKDILKMETAIVNKLEYRITVPSAHAFLVRYLKAAHADKKIVQLSFYILDGTLQNYDLQHYLPSELAAAAVMIARKTVGRNAWSPTLLKYASYCEEDVVLVANHVLSKNKSASSELHAVKKKYSSSRFGSVADIELYDGEY